MPSNPRRPSHISTTVNLPRPSLQRPTSPSSPALTLPKSSPTRYTKPGVSNTSSAPDIYTLEAVYLAWLLRDAPGAEYMRQARESGLTVGFVSVTERKSIVEWLEGKVADLERIKPLASESTTPPGTPPRRAGVTAAAPSTTPKHLSHSHTTDATSPSKRRYVADAQDMEVVKRIKQNEVELRDRNTVLRGCQTQRTLYFPCIFIFLSVCWVSRDADALDAQNFSALHASFAERLKKLRDVKPGSTPAPAPSTGPPMQARKAKNMFPIIMISSSPTALITMYNVKRFLQEAVFEPSSTARERAAAAGNPRAEDLLPIDRRRDAPTASTAALSSSTLAPSTSSAASHGAGTGTVQRYFIVDSTDALQKFGADAWERVVCVMTTGQAWQFRPYKWNEPRTLFHHVKGVYFTWANDPPNSKIKDWNVTELKVTSLSLVYSIDSAHAIVTR
ncbi:RNA pol II accessory factor, Cdc73 family-domain-containing protein [Boletus reticuloceps]|uniref:RNA pol II accessory factor, Cdc73 family-domain-containing protein n=1 Tax=Boletus reticuloceps TaxID=495285 RepID=A0A8I2YTB0_9AGAM|nr:RNA pol II accessory factor, Cdc73 family-domain-containing protein [Boletus reticuloceps]